MHCALLRNHVIFAHVNNCHLAASTKYAQISESTESTESGEPGESGEPSDSMFPSIPCAAPLCIVHYALCIFQGEAPHPPHAQPKYSCASWLCDTVRCHFVRLIKSPRAAKLCIVHYALCTEKLSPLSFLVLLLRLLIFMKSGKKALN